MEKLYKEKNINISRFFYSLDFLDEDRCREVILEMLHPGGPACPHCKTKLPKERHTRWFQNKHSSCGGCSRKFFATTGTVFNSLKIPFAEVVMIRFLFELGYRPNQIKRFLNRNGETIRTARKRFEAMEATL
jgi:transposase-like protein